MAIIDQSGNTQFEMDNLDTHTINVRKTAYYRLKVGSGGSPDFGGETISVEQGGDPLPDLGALAAYSDSIVHLIGGQLLSFIPSGALTSVVVELYREIAPHAR